MEECYDVEALNITVIIEGDGEVELNSVDLVPENSPWTGTYYSGLPVSISANIIASTRFEIGTQMSVV